jgi:hypothetical protein
VLGLCQPNTIHGDTPSHSLIALSKSEPHFNMHCSWSVLAALLMALRADAFHSAGISHSLASQSKLSRHLYGAVACEKKADEQTVATPSGGLADSYQTADDIVAELAARQAGRPERPMSKGLPELPGTAGLPPAAQIAITVLLVGISAFAFDGGAWMYQ